MNLIILEDFSPLQVAVSVYSSSIKSDPGPTVVGDYINIMKKTYFIKVLIQIVNKLFLNYKFTRNKEELY